MSSGFRFLVLLPLTVLLGCGSSASPSSTTAATAYNFNGTWAGVYTSGAPLSMPFTNFSGALQASSSGAVTGTLTLSAPYNSASNPNLCSANGTPLTVTGTLDDTHDLVLNFPVAGGTGTLTATLGDDPATSVVGSWQIVGGTCAMSLTTMKISGTPTSPTVASTPVPPTANLSGNWAVVVNANVTSPDPVIGFSGALGFSNGSVTGVLTETLNAATSFCRQIVGTPAAAAVSGTFDANNNLTLTLPIAGGTATITATLGSNPQTLADGSFQIDGGSCDMNAVPMTIAQYAPLTGTYTGTFSVAGLGNVPTAGSNVAVTAVLTQSPTANVSGQYPVIGTVSVTGADCTESVSLAGTTVAGNSLVSPSSPSLAGMFGPTAATVYSASYSSTNCPALYQGTLTRQ